MPAGAIDKVEAYLAALPPEPRAALQKLREQIRAAAPQAQEGFGYGLPGFYLEGPLFYYGAAKAHLALYGDRPAGFDGDLEPFKTSKGAVQFTLEKPLPANLVRRLVQAKAAANHEAQQAKAKRRA